MLAKSVSENSGVNGSEEGWFSSYKMAQLCALIKAEITDTNSAFSFVVFSVSSNFIIFLHSPFSLNYVCFLSPLLSLGLQRQGWKHCISCKTRVTESHHLKGFQILAIVTAVMEKNKGYSIKGSLKRNWNKV